jgi:signal transduction histidine kinase
VRGSTQRRTGHTIDLRQNWLVVLTTSLTTLTLPYLLERPHSWVSTACLVPVILAAWIFDPLILAVAVVSISMVSIGAAHRLQNPIWAPEPLMMWLTVALIHLVRIERQLRQDLFRKDAELREDKSLQLEWRTFFDQSPAAILTADGEGKIIMGNPAACKLLGFEDQPIRGQGVAHSLTALGAALRIDRNTTLFHTLTGCTGWRPNGEMFVADAWFSVGETPRGTRLCAVIVDASERLQDRAQGGLRSSMATSQIAMGAVLHEIRNLSAAAALMYANLANTEDAHFAELKKNADFEALGSLLKALANLAAAELRPGTSSHSSVDLSGVLAQFRIIVLPWFLESEIAVNWEIPSELPNVFGEESGLLQVFLNLAQNSHKAMLASDVRQLTVQARVESECVVVRFRDTGPGVANPEDLFEPFRRTSGIKGLGLFVSRAIAHSFYGELKYVAEESGSCFAVELLPLREYQKVAVDYERGEREN